MEFSSALKNLVLYLEDSDNEGNECKLVNSQYIKIIRNHLSKCTGYD